MVVTYDSVLTTNTNQQADEQPDNSGLRFFDFEANHYEATE